MKQLNIWKNVRDLLLRYIMICVFMFMCTIVIATSPKILGPVLGIFYFIALIYYFWFTMKTEGGLDVNRVKTGQMPQFRWKGLLCAAIVAVPLILINFIPNFFPDPTPAEYHAYFTGKVTELGEQDAFNVSLREKSGKGGYISQITFEENREITRIVYVTAAGETVVCDGKTQDADKQYALVTGVSESGQEEYVFYTDKAELTEAQLAAFSECKNAIDDIASVMGEYPHWQKALSIVKVVCVISLQYFCTFITGLFGASGNVMLNSAVYALAMAVICVAAQVGYEMGYRNIEILRKRKPKNDPKAGDTIVIQRGRKSDETE